MTKKDKLWLTAAGLIIIALLVGSWDSMELEKRAFIISIGVDKDENGVTAALEIPEIQYLEVDEDKAPIQVESGATFGEALAKATKSLNRQAFYGQAKVLLLSEELLGDSKLLEDVLDYLKLDNEISDTLIVLATDKAPADILGSLDLLTGLFISDYYKNTPDTPTIRLEVGELRDTLNRSGDIIIPRITMDDKDNLSFMGGALLHDSSFAAWLDEEQMQGLAWIIDSDRATGAEINSGDGIALRTTKIKLKRSFAEQDGHIVMLVNLDITGHLESGSLYEGLESELAREAQKQAVSAFEMLRDDYGSDALQLMDSLKKKNYPLYQRYSGDIRSAYSKMELQVSATVRIEEGRR